MPFISSSWLTAVAKASSTMLDKNGASGSPMGVGGAPVRFMGKWVNRPCPKATQPFTDTPKAAQVSTAWPRQPTPQQSISSAGLCYRESRVWGYCIPLADAARKGVLPPRKMAPGVGEWLSTGILAAVPSACSPGHNPSLSSGDSILIHPLSSEPRVSGCKQDFMLWTFKREHVSLADSSLFLRTESLLIFSVMWVCLPGSALRPHASQGEPLRQLRSLYRMSTSLRVGPARYASLPFPPVSMWSLL